MFRLNNVTLRPLELDDMDSLYTWMADIEFCLWGGWTPVIELALSRDAFRPLFEQHFVQATEDQVTLGVEFEQRLVGFVQLARIDQRMRRAIVGIGIGEKEIRGQGYSGRSFIKSTRQSSSWRILQISSAGALSFCYVGT